MERVSNPCQDQFLYPLLVKSPNEKRKEVQVAKCGTPKIKIKKLGVNIIYIFANSFYPHK